MKKKRLKRRLKAQSTLLMETTQLAVALKGRISVLEKKVERLSLYYGNLDKRVTAQAFSPESPTAKLKLTRGQGSQLWAERIIREEENNNNNTG